MMNSFPFHFVYISMIGLVWLRFICLAGKTTRIMKDFLIALFLSPFDFSVNIYFSWFFFQTSTQFLLKIVIFFLFSLFFFRWNSTTSYLNCKRFFFCVPSTVLVLMQSNKLEWQAKICYKPTTNLYILCALCRTQLGRVTF